MPTVKPPKRPKRFAQDITLPTNSLIGRRAELAKLQDAIADPHNRVTTLVGIEGVGKTRLALEALRSLINPPDGSSDDVSTSSFAPSDDVYFLYLPSNCDWETTLLVVFAEALQLPMGRAAQQQVFEYVSTRQMFCVFDNFPRDPDAIVSLSDLLTQAPGLKLLLTGAEPLQLLGERVIQVESFSQMASCAMTTSAQSDWRHNEAITLFTQRAAALPPNHFIAQEEAEPVLRLCQSLQGLPISIELAATAFHGMDAATLAHYVEHKLAREANLGGNYSKNYNKGEQAAHRAFIVLLDLLWVSLSKWEKSVLMYLSIFQHTFSHQAALMVGMTSTSLLQNLLKKSLLRQIAPNRYMLPRIIRRYLVAKRQAEEVLNDDAWQRFSSYTQQYNKLTFSKV